MNVLRQKNTEAFAVQHRVFRDALERFEAQRSLAAARGVFLATFHLAPVVVHDKQVPASEVKAFEKVVRDADRRRYPKDVGAWLLKNREGLLALARSVNWPDKGTGDESRVGSFLVHNQTGRDVSANIKLLETAETLMRDSGIPRIDDAVYGDVYFVGDIAKKRTTMARYYPDSDAVHIIVVKRFEAGILHSIIHEFGHRYYQRICKNGPARAQWSAHHRMVGRAGDIPLPKPGDVLPTAKGEQVVREIGSDRHGNITIVLESGAYIPWSGYARVMAQKAYPTIYASTDPEEHFCEAFALFCMGELAEPHRAAFEEIVGVERRPAPPPEPPPAPPPAPGPKGQIAMFNPSRRASALHRRITGS